MLTILAINMQYKVTLLNVMAIFVISDFLNADVGSQYNNFQKVK